MDTDRRQLLPRATPARMGLAPSAVTAFLDSLGSAGTGEGPFELHSLMVVVRGAVVVEGWWDPYGADRPHQLYSLSKSFTSTAVGFAVAEGLLTVDDLVVSFFPDVPAHPSLAGLRVRHLLTMSTGHREEPSDVFEQRDWVTAFLATPLPDEPGTGFVYNTPATYMLSAILQTLTEQRLLDYLEPRLLAPLGVVGATWEQCPSGIDTGGFGLSLATEDVACFGQLFLDDGVWQGRRLLPEGWVAEATRSHVASVSESGDSRQGYGYQFWRNEPAGYRADGAFGQFCLVLPEQHAVIVTTAGTGDQQGVLSRIWRTLLPGFGAAPGPADEQDHAELAARLARLSIDPPAGARTSTTAARISGRTYGLRPTSGSEVPVAQVRLDEGVAGTHLRIEHRDVRADLDAGHGQWLPGTLWTSQWGDLAAVSSGGWTDDRTFLLTVRMIETPFALTVTATFTGEQVHVVVDANVAFGPTRLADLTGEAQPRAGAADDDTPPDAPVRERLPVHSTGLAFGRTPLA